MVRTNRSPARSSPFFVTSYGVTFNSTPASAKSASWFELALYPKKSDEITDNFNYVFFIYSATVSSKNNKFNPTKVYYPVRFKDIVNCDEMEYEESSKKIVGDFYFEGSFNDSVGYRDPNTMYSDIVTANRDTYKSEVSETFKYLIQ